MGVLYWSTLICSSSSSRLIQTNMAPGQKHKKKHETVSNKQAVSFMAVYWVWDKKRCSHGLRYVMMDGVAQPLDDDVP